MPPPDDGIHRHRETPGRILLERYRIERSLGTGGMGEVLLAHDEVLHRRVALKRLRTDGNDPAARRHAILKEARRLSQVNDSRIAAIHDVLELDGDVLLVMEYVDGTTLREHMTRPLSPARILAAGRSVRRGARRGACARRDPPRHQAREPDGDAGRHGQDPRLRACDPCAATGHDDADDDTDAGSAGRGHARVHGARGAPRQADGRAHRPVLTGRRVLRDADRRAPVRRRHLRGRSRHGAHDHGARRWTRGTRP